MEVEHGSQAYLVRLCLCRVHQQACKVVLQQTPDLSAANACQCSGSLAASVKPGFELRLPQKLRCMARCAIPCTGRRLHEICESVCSYPETPAIDFRPVYLVYHRCRPRQPSAYLFVHHSLYMIARQAISRPHSDDHRTGIGRHLRATVAMWIGYYETLHSPLLCQLSQTDCWRDDFRCRQHSGLHL